MDSFVVTGLTSRASVMLKATKTDLAPAFPAPMHQICRAAVMLGAIAVIFHGQTFSRQGIPLAPNGRISRGVLAPAAVRLDAKRQ